MRSTESRHSDEQGVALIVAVFALAILGGLVTITYTAGLLELESGRNTLFVSQAAEAAEGEVRQILGSTPVSTVVTLPIQGAPLDLGTVSLGGIRIVRQLARLTDNLFLVQARGVRVNADGKPLATRAVGLLVGVAVDSTSGRDSLVPLTQRAWVQLY